MNKYKVCVYAIAKNEEKFVDRWVASMCEADELIVVDTGSSDGTAERLKEHGVKVYRETITPWRFDTARNISLSHVPEDGDICVCTDLDEVFEAGWRESLEAVWTDDMDGGNYIYNWSLKKDGRPDVQFVYSKVHKRKGYEWVYPVHEYLRYIGSKKEKRVFIPGMVLNHYPDAQKSRGSYLGLLKLAVEEDPLDDRMNYYLGREYMYAGQWESCIHTLKNYLRLEKAVWNEERCAAMRWIAKSYEMLNDRKQAGRWYYRAIAENKHSRDAYIEFALMAYRSSDWAAVFCFSEEALKIKERSGTYVNMGYAWDETPYDLAALSCYHLGMFGRALEYAKEAVSIAPDNERLLQNLNAIEQAAAANCNGIFQSSRPP